MQRLFAALTALPFALALGLAVQSWMASRDALERAQTEEIERACEKAVDLAVTGAALTHPEALVLAGAQDGSVYYVDDGVDPINHPIPRLRYAPRVTALCTAPRERLHQSQAGSILDVNEGQVGRRRYGLARVTRATDRGNDRMVIEVGRPLPTADDLAEIQQARRQTIVVAALSFIAGLAAVAYLTLRLGAMTRVLRRVGSGDLAARVDGDADPTEFGALSREINGAVARIEDQVGTLQLAEARAGHELIAPIDRALSRLVVMESTRLSARAKGELEAIRDQLRSASAAARSLLEMARNSNSPKVAIPLAELIREMVADELEARDAQVDLDLDPSVRTLARPDRLRIVLGNLLRNARQYAQGRIEIVLQRRAEAMGHTFRLQISNPAANVDADIRQLFVRGRDDGQGFGMGLDTVRAAAIGEGMMFGVEARSERFSAWLTGVALTD